MKTGQKASNKIYKEKTVELQSIFMPFGMILHCYKIVRQRKCYNDRIKKIEIQEKMYLFMLTIMRTSAFKRKFMAFLKSFLQSYIQIVVMIQMWKKAVHFCHKTNNNHNKIILIAVCSK